jgi:hypothetical protein
VQEVHLAAAFELPERGLADQAFGKGRGEGLDGEGYAKLKLRLAAEFRRDREAYTNAKSEFVTSVVGVA